MRIFASETTTIDFDSEQQYIKVVRNVPRALSEESYRETMLQWLGISEKYRPTKVLLEQTNNYFFVTSALQSWVQENVLVLLHERGLRKIAFVVSKDLLVNASQELIFEEFEMDLFDIAYFSNIELAEKWLLEEGEG